MATFKIVIIIASLISCSAVIYKVISLQLNERRYDKARRRIEKSESIERCIHKTMLDIGLVNEFYSFKMTQRFDRVITRKNLGHMFDINFIRHVNFIIHVKYTEERQEVLEKWRRANN